jgi:hypothetical protein
VFPFATSVTGAADAVRQERHHEQLRASPECRDRAGPGHRWGHHEHRADLRYSEKEDGDRDDFCGSPAATHIVVSLEPRAAQVEPGGSVSFTASVTGSADAGVAWSVQEGAAGGSVTASGVYTAPATPGTYHLVAASHADPTTLESATVTVVAPPVAPPVAQPATVVAVTLGPSSSAVEACGSVTFRATVSGSDDPTVLWSVKEGQAGGVVSPVGIYTAPSTAGTFHVVAASAADPTRSAEATVVVGPEKVLSVAVAPGPTSVSSGGVLAFSAVVTTTCGSFAAR